MASPNTKWHRLRVVCVNDVYSFTAVDGHGGWARAITLMRRLRDQAFGPTSASDSDPPTTVLTTVNGDVMGGSSLLQHSKGRLAIDIMNEIPIDACVLGNHEFDYGPTELQSRLDTSNFSWFGSNVVKSDTNALLDGVLDYKVHSLSNGLKVGMFGLCTCATPQLSAPTDAISFLDLETTAKRIVSHLREVEGVHVVVALTHVSSAQDKDLAEAVPDIDLILGGHDHEPLALDHHHTLVFKCGQNGYWVGVVDLDVKFEVDANDSIIGDSVEIFPSWHMHSTSRVEADPGIKAIVERYQAEVDAQVLRSHGDELKGMQLDDIVATVKGEVLDTRTTQVRRKETTSGNLVADALLSYYTDNIIEDSGDSDVDTLAFINGGFIRGDTRYNVGTNLILRDILEEMPFPRTSCLLELQGKHLRLGLEQQLRACPAAFAGFPHLSHNVRLEYDVSSPALSRIRRLTVNGRDVDDEKKYRVVVPQHVASGGDGCSAWCFGVHRAIENLPGKRISIITLDYLLKRGVADAAIEGRVVCGE